MTPENDLPKSDIPASGTPSSGSNNAIWVAVISAVAAIAAAYIGYLGVKSKNQGPVEPARNASEVANPAQPLKEILKPAESSNQYPNPIPPGPAPTDESYVRTRQFFQRYMTGGYFKVTDCCMTNYDWALLELNNCVLRFKEDDETTHTDNKPTTHESYDVRINLTRLPAASIWIETSRVNDMFKQITIGDSTETALTITETSPIQRTLKYNQVSFTMNATDAETVTFLTDFETVRQSCAAN